MGLFFKVYAVVSVLLPIWIVKNTVDTNQGQFFDTVVMLTSNKLNLVLALNGVISILFLIANMLTYVFFGQIRQVESKVSAAKSEFDTC